MLSGLMLYDNVQPVLYQNQNLWNVESCNLFIAIVFAKLVPGLEFRCAWVPLFRGSIPVQ
jgi:hypothetical protein